MNLLFYILLLLHVHFCCSRTLISTLEEKRNTTLPIQTNFQLPSPLPTWSQDGGFGRGEIDLGGLLVRQVSNLKNVWATLKGGPNNQGATFFEPSSIPDGFFMLGSYSQPNNKPLFGWVLVAKDLSHNQDILKNPIDYTLVWSSKALKKMNQEDVGYIWLPTAPHGYKAVGLVVTNTPQKPSLDKVRCVRADFTEAHSHDQWIWGSSNDLKIHNSRPNSQGKGVYAGTFIATLGSGALVPDACLKNTAPANASKYSSMPTIAQIRELIAEYSPRFYFHPLEQYFPLPVADFFEKGSSLYTKGNKSAPATAVRVGKNGENLPQGGWSDGAFWIDLPKNDRDHYIVKHGDRNQDYPCLYVHAKPTLGNTHTDLAIWMFYPFNGCGIIKLWFVDISLGFIGQHVGDWEHVTLRINNFNGALESVYFSQHAKGQWVDAHNLEYFDGNKFLVYSSLHGHAAYPDKGEHIAGGWRVGLVNAARNSTHYLDTNRRFEVFSTANETGFEPQWLNYARNWGPKILYKITDLIRKVDRKLPKWLKPKFEKVIRNLPKELFCEEGPSGPKFRGNWDGDETTANGNLGACFDD